MTVRGLGALLPDKISWNSFQVGAVASPSSLDTIYLFISFGLTSSISSSVQLIIHAQLYCSHCDRF